MVDLAPIYSDISNIPTIKAGMAREPSIKSPEFLLRIRNVSRGKQNIGNNNADNNKGIFSGKMIHLSLSLGVRIHGHGGTRSVLLKSAASITLNNER